MARRVNVTKVSNELRKSGEPITLGWFDVDKADKFREATWWDGSHDVPVAVRDRFNHEQLFRTAGGHWVLREWSQLEGKREAWTFVSLNEARTWLLANDCDSACEDHFGPIEEEQGPVRLGTGPIVGLRIPNELYDWSEPNESLRRALDRIEIDPQGAITAARSHLESVCKHICDERAIAYDNKWDLGKLYKAVAIGLGILTPESTEMRSISPLVRLWRSLQNFGTVSATRTAMGRGVAGRLDGTPSLP